MVKLAIAEDLAAIREGLTAMIDTLDGFECVHAAENGQTLLNRIEASGVIPDVCLLDIKMPLMDGYATASVLRQRWPDMRLIALSAHNEEYNVIRMLRHGANAYLSKAANRVEVYNALKAVMTDGVYYNDMLSGKLLNRVRNNEYDHLLLSDLDLEFMSWVCTDLSYRDIASHMHLSERSLETLREALFEKLNIHFRSGLVVYALSIGLDPKKY